MEENDFILPNEGLNIKKKGFKPIYSKIKTIPMKSITLKKIEQIEKNMIDEYIKNN